MSNDNFIFKEELSDIEASNFPEPARDLEAELFGKKGIKEALDGLERELGYGKKEERTNVRFHNKILSPDAEEDRKLLNELLNDPRFFIMDWKDSWTAHGNYKVFIIFGENLEVSKKLKKDGEDEDESEE